MIPILILALAIFLVIKLKKDSLFIFGGFLLASSLFVYEKAIVVVLGIILILVRLFIRKGRWERRKYYGERFPYDWGYSPYLSPRRDRTRQATKRRYEERKAEERTEREYARKRRNAERRERKKRERDLAREERKSKK